MNEICKAHRTNMCTQNIKLMPDMSDIERNHFQMSFGIYFKEIFTAND